MYCVTYEMFNNIAWFRHFAIFGSSHMAQMFVNQLISNNDFRDLKVWSEFNEKQA